MGAGENLALHQAVDRIALCDMKQVPPFRAEDEWVDLLQRTAELTGLSKAGVIKRCVTAHAPQLVATIKNPVPAKDAINLFKFDKKKVKKVREARRGSG
jgi:hypothetical protein